MAICSSIVIHTLSDSPDHHSLESMTFFGGSKETDRYSETAASRYVQGVLGISALDCAATKVVAATKLTITAVRRHCGFYRSKCFNCVAVSVAVAVPAIAIKIDQFPVHAVTNWPSVHRAAQLLPSAAALPHWNGSCNLLRGFCKDRSATFPKMSRQTLIQPPGTSSSLVNDLEIT